MQSDNASQQDGNIAIVVGRGQLPGELVAGLMAKGRSPVLVGIEGETEPWLENFEHKIFAWGQLGAFFKHLKQSGVRQVLLAGSVTRPKIELSKMDMGAMASLPRVMAFMIGGDNSLLSGVIDLFGSKGIEVLGVHEVLPELLAEKGKIAGATPSRTAKRNIEKAFEACKLLGKLDIGQAAVAVGGRVVAVEGIEGTDGMLERVAGMRASGRLYENGTHGVLVKTMKPGQDMRADLPAIGPKTIEMISAAGLRGVAIEAGHSLVLARSETLSAAKREGVFIHGMETAQGAWDA